jgi:glycosyltransferase involved in cell wall biosynthesis
MPSSTRPQRIWLLNIGEPLPTVLDSERRLRMGLLAETLAVQGHEVVWWSSTFDHNYKRQIVDFEQRIPVRGGLDLELLRAMTYTQNVSLRRFLNHFQIARRFEVRARTAQPPDVILCTVPTIELAASAVAYGRRAGVPVIVDVRDLWPDIFVDIFPRIGQPLARLLLDPLFRTVDRALAGADAITAVSRTYLEWGLRRAGRPASPRDRVFPLGYPRPSAPASAREGAARSLAVRGVDAEKRIIWFVGMFGRTYDLSTVIRAAGQLEAEGVENLQFVLSGAGDRDERWRAEAAGLRSVVFTGWVAAAEIEYLLSVAWAGLVAYAPGAPQSLPNKVFEYMSGGLPVLSSLVGEAEDLLARHGLGVSYRAGDADSLAAAIRTLLQNPTRHRTMGDASRQTYERHYAADVVYNRMAAYVASGARANVGTVED